MASGALLNVNSIENSKERPAEKANTKSVRRRRRRKKQQQKNRHTHKIIPNGARDGEGGKV